MLGNLRLKLLALFFALSLWSVVAYSSNPTQHHQYRMAVSNVSETMPSGLTLVGDPPVVPVTVIATADNLSRFDPHNLRLSANFAGVHVGNNQVPIRVDNSDPAVQVDAPQTVSASVDQLATANPNVTIERINSLAPGYHEQTNATTVTPASVRVDGPKSKLNGIQAAVIIDLDTVNNPGVNKAYPVVVRDGANKEIKSVRITPSTVTVKMVVEADSITVAKAVGWTLTGQPAAGYRVTNVQVTPLQVQATGLQNTLGSFSLLATDPVDITNQKADVIRTVSIRAPNGVEVSPKSVSVHVFIGPAPGVSPTSSP